MTDKLALRILSQQCSSRRRELTDKLRCREIVRKICPELRIKKVYGIYERPEQFSLAALPRSFVLKPNGASGLDMMVLDKRAASEEELRRTIAEWLRINYFESTQEPSYRGIKNKVFAEELILSEENYYPLELCIFCFHRKARFVDYDMDPNVPDHSELFDTDWNPLCIEYSHEQLDPMRMGCPPRLKEAIQVAERLAEGLDFVRVDLYDLPDGLAFGEMTSYPWGGLVKLSPPGADESLGRYWEPYSASPVDCVKFRSCSRDRRIRSKGPGTE